MNAKFNHSQNSEFLSELRSRSWALKKEFIQYGRSLICNRDRSRQFVGKVEKESELADFLMGMLESRTQLAEFQKLELVLEAIPDTTIFRFDDN